MNWGKSIVLVFVLFAGFIGTMVVSMSRQRIDLVRDDYYQDEIAYQQHIDRVANAARLTNKVPMTYLADTQEVAVFLPASLRKGTLLFYRPADRVQDFKVKIPQDHAARQLVSTKGLLKGHWRVQFTWSDGQRDYYTEQELFL